ncbi:MAG: histidine triad nucleotide-binding protein [Acetobacteraceae bacterium]
MPVSALEPYDDGNIFARILRGETPCRKVMEDAFALAFYDINPQAPVHVLVIPRRAYVSFADFSARAGAEEIAGFFRAAGAVARQLGLEAPGYRIIANAGFDASQEVPHFHVHILAGRPFGHRLVPEIVVRSAGSGEGRDPESG